MMNAFVSETQVLIRTASLFGCLVLSCLAQSQWQQSFDAGYVDERGRWAGGSEIMHLVSHKEALYAANSYWVDAKWVIPPDGQKQSAQVLRLGAPEAKWQVDLDLGAANDFGLQYMKGNILKSVTFTRDADGKPLPEPKTLLVMAAGANFDRGGAVSAWVRDDGSGNWKHELVRHGSNAGGVRWVPRDMELHLDPVTGRERLFLLLGNPGVLAGSYDPKAPTGIRWDRHVEFPFLNQGSFTMRPLGLVRANGKLYMSEGPRIYERLDGERPTFNPILDLQTDTDADVGGIRGLTTIPNPTGAGESILFLWAPGDRSSSEIKRLDPDGTGGYRLHDEVRIIDLMSKALDVKITYTLGAHNMMVPVTNPKTGKTVHLVGFQGNMAGKNHLKWSGSALYAGAMYAVRDADQNYTVHEVNNRYAPKKPILVAPRAFCLSPFGDDQLYIGGHDSSFKRSDNMAWIFRSPLKVALGLEVGTDAEPAAAEPVLDPRLTAGPVYELRVYQANEDRFGHLVQRFREHTDRLFKKHGMIPVGYWVPTEGTARQRRRFVYILKHPSRYQAYTNWLNFSNDGEWKRVLERPEFQRLLSGKPDSIFLTPNELRKEMAFEGEGLFELRTSRSLPEKLPEVQRLFREQAELLRKHDLSVLANYAAFDRPEVHDTHVCLVRHASRAAADKNWASLSNEAAWKPIDDLLREPTERLFLKPFPFSPLK